MYSYFSSKKMAKLKEDPIIVTFQNACEKGDIKTVKIVSGMLTPSDARAKSKCYTYFEDSNFALGIACYRGHLEVARWISEYFGLTREDARSGDNFAFIHACEHGYLGVAQWLTEYFELTTEDARSVDNHALRWACISGHVDVVYWLVEHFGLTYEDVRSALGDACSSGNLKLAQWLTEHFGLTSDDARANNNCALSQACVRGYFPTVQWLALHFGLTPEDARSRDNHALREACKHNYLDLAQWLVLHFRLTPEDAGEFAHLLNFVNCEIEPSTEVSLIIFREACKNISIFQEACKNNDMETVKIFSRILAPNACESIEEGTLTSEDDYALMMACKKWSFEHSSAKTQDGLFLGGE